MILELRLDEALDILGYVLGADEDNAFKKHRGFLMHLKRRQTAPKIFGVTDLEQSRLMTRHYVSAGLGEVLVCK